MSREMLEVPGEGDLGLLRAIQARDRSALETLYLGYRTRLGLFLGRFIYCRDTVEEVINDSFMVVWTRARGFRAESQVSTWIFGIAYRTAMKALRMRSMAYRLTEDVDPPEHAIYPTVDAELRDWIEVGLKSLPVDQRLTIRLAYQYGFSVDEIAVIMASPAGTVKSRMFHARVKLRARAFELGA
jgi:RNA polymerase sigma-70 factor (ECF subfamily)